MSKSATAPTAQTVRAFFNADEKRLARLSPEAAKTVAAGARGRLHPEVIKGYNKGRKAERQYVLGATRNANAAKSALREQAAKAGHTVGKRGPLPKAFLDSLKG